MESRLPTRPAGIAGKRGNASYHHLQKIPGPPLPSGAAIPYDRLLRPPGKARSRLLPPTGASGRGGGRTGCYRSSSSLVPLLSEPCDPPCVLAGSESRSSVETSSTCGTYHSVSADPSCSRVAHIPHHVNKVSLLCPSSAGALSHPVCFLPPTPFPMPLCTATAPLEPLLVVSSCSSPCVHLRFP